MLLTVAPAVIELARVALSRIDPALAIAHEMTPPFAWRAKPSGFPGLVRLVLEQQVSVASADALWRRLEQALGTVGIEEVLAWDVERLRLLGLSGQKARYIRAIAEAHAGGAVDLLQLAALDDESARATLVALKGIGRWTAEAYLMVCEARTDLFPAGDIALQEAIRILDRLPVRPTEKALYVRAEKWRPHRSIAAHLLWVYYTGIRRKTIAMPEGVPPILAGPRQSPKRGRKIITAAKPERVEVAG